MNNLWRSNSIFRCHTCTTKNFVNNRMPKSSLDISSYLAKRSRARNEEHYEIQLTAPSKLSASELKPIVFTELKLNTFHYGCIIVLRIVVEHSYEFVQTSLAEDRFGELVQLKFVYSSAFSRLDLVLGIIILRFTEHRSNSHD